MEPGNESLFLLKESVEAMSATVSRLIEERDMLRRENTRMHAALLRARDALDDMVSAGDGTSQEKAALATVNAALGLAVAS